LTGTPIENRLLELWSIFDFLNPGYLGSMRAFHRSFVKPIERNKDEETLARLQRLVRPFLLRRTKKDEHIQLSLPDKLEQHIFVSLTAEQAVLYEQQLEKLLNGIDRLSAMERRGQILAVLTKLKQICDHPSLFEGENSKPTDEWIKRSNKLARLLEMIDEARAENQRCIIFTQYVRMGRMIAAALENRFGKKVSFLHGGVAKEERDRLVAAFQAEAIEGEESSDIFILSLKAGGTGLNLTAATHVFHFDRWWNPAVENQATDRAYRIGQTKQVQVHKFVSLGTLEERIHEMIARKQALSENIVGAGESWITEMSTDEIKDLFRLRREWLEEEEV
jgi:SNF2 family DNA or RNA helicase